MSHPSSDSSSAREPRPGQLAAAISTAVVHLFSHHTGRGPTQARTALDHDAVVVFLRESMTKAERSLVQAGRAAEVLELRRTFQETMEADLVGTVERLTDRKVSAFMSANHIDPDVAVEIFMLDRAMAEPGAGMTAA